MPDEKAPALHGPYGLPLDRERYKPASKLADRVLADIEALTADLPMEGGTELPHPAPDLTTYADAYALAVKGCPHKNVYETLYARREGQCQDCGAFVHNSFSWGSWK